MLEGPDAGTLRAWRPGVLDQILDRIFAPRLDRQLADGADPDRDRRLALRAQRLVEARHRTRLEQGWARVLALSTGSRSAPQAPLVAHRLRVVEREITELVAALRAPRPLGAAGAAMAEVLLTDGGGPLYRHSPPEELRMALCAALEHLRDADLGES